MEIKLGWKGKFENKCHDKRWLEGSQKTVEWEKSLLFMGENAIPKWRLWYLLGVLGLVVLCKHNKYGKDFYI